MPWKTKAILAVAALATIGMLVIFGHEPGRPDTHDTCPSKGIDPQTLNEGICLNDGTKTVVVDRGHLLKLGTLDARLEGIRRRTTLSGPGGKKSAKGAFVTFDLAITNRTDSPERVREDQMVLTLQRVYGEDVEAEEEFEADSFQAGRNMIPPGATVRGTVTFQIPPKQVKVMDEEGNLDLANFAATGGNFEPEAVLEGAEVGVIRTYRKPRSG